MPPEKPEICLMVKCDVKNSSKNLGLLLQPMLEYVRNCRNLQKSVEVHVSLGNWKNEL